MRLLVLLALALRSRGFDFDDEDEAAVAPTSSVFFSDESTGSTSTLEHSLGGNPFAPRSKLFYQSLAAAMVANGANAKVRVSQAKLSGEDLDTVRALAKDGGFYTLRLPSKLDDPTSPMVSASITACSLVASQFQEHLQLTMSSNGRVLALSYVVPKVPHDCTGTSLPRIALDEVLFNTTVSMRFPDEGQKPEGKIHDAAFLPPAAAAAARAALSADGKDGGDGQQQPPQSFLRKYWMYILPAILIFTMGGDQPPEGDKGDAGGSSGSGATKPSAGGSGGRRRS